MKVYLIKNTLTSKYYLKKHRWDTRIHCESFFTEQAAKWHRTYVINASHIYTTLERRLDDKVVIEEYEMIKIN